MKDDSNKNKKLFCRKLFILPKEEGINEAKYKFSENAAKKPRNSAKIQNNSNPTPLYMIAYEKL